MNRYQMIITTPLKEMAAKMPCPYVVFSNKKSCIHKNAINKDCRKCCEDWLMKKV